MTVPSVCRSAILLSGNVPGPREGLSGVLKPSILVLLLLLEDCSGSFHVCFTVHVNPPLIVPRKFVQVCCSGKVTIELDIAHVAELLPGCALLHVHLVLHKADELCVEIATVLQGC